MRFVSNLVRLGLALPLLALAEYAGAQTLDVKPGLWEMSMAGQGSAMRMCLTAELIKASATMVANPPGIPCTNQVSESGSRRMVIHTTCTGAVPVEGDTRVEVTSPEAMTMVSTSRINIGGNTQNVEASMNYKWLGADCGDVKPFDPGNPTP